MAGPTRVEQILKSMLGLAEEIPKPQSRVEELLIDLKQAIEAGGSGDLTEIVGRISTLETDVGRIKMVDDAQNEVLDKLDENVVRKTDYANNMQAGVVMINGYGLSMSNGVLQINMASDDDINAETNTRRPVIPSKIGLIMSNYHITKETIPSIQKELDSCVKKTEIGDIMTRLNKLESDLASLQRG